jgi:phosphohistidine swiveling domain-containing protein
MRGKSITGAYEWFKEQDINPEDYKADFVPHAEVTNWATIFIVNKNGIQGEIIQGGHHQLTQGLHDGKAPMVFRYGYKKWEIEPENKDALEHVKKLASLIHVPDAAKQKELEKRLGSTFASDYMEGYFETSESSMGIWYIDYNQSLGKMYADASFKPVASDADAKVKGQTGSPGKATGPVCIVPPDGLDVDFPEGGILVCKVTTPDYVPLMRKAAAIVTDQGGILAHAAIVARELKKPCIVGTGNATEMLKVSQKVTVDADSGTVV